MTQVMPRSRPQKGGEALSPLGLWIAESKATFALALPLVLAALCQVAIWTTDVIMVGWLGPQPLAAAALAINLQFSFITFGFGVMTAVAPLVAQARGAYQPRGVRRSVRQGLWAGAVIMVALAPIYWFSEGLILQLGQDPENAVGAGVYLRWALPGIGPVLWIMVLRMFIAAFDKAHVVTYITAAGILVNAVTNYALIFGNFGFPALGLAGAGIASSVTNWLMFLWLLAHVVYRRPFRRYTILVRLWRPDWQRFREVFRLGTPIGLAMTLETMLFTVAAYLMGLLGTVPLAAHSIVLQCAAVSFMVPMGISQAATIRVGLNAGRGSAAGAFRAGWVALAMGCAFMALVALIFLTQSEAIIGAFIEEGDPGSAAVLELAMQFMLLAAIFQIFDGAQVIGAGALRGLKDVTVPLVASLVSYWVIGLSASLALGFYFDQGGAGIWKGFVLGLGMAALLHVGRFWWLRGRTR